MTSSQFVLMYHPLIAETISDPVRVALQSVDDHAARGWLLVDPEEVLPEPSTPYYTKEALLSQISGGAAPIGTALRAAFGSVTVADIRRFGAVIDGTTDDRQAIVDAITSLGSRGGIVYFPPGITAVGSTIVIPSNIRLVGAGKNASIVLKVFNGLLFDFSGTSTSARCQRGGMADIQMSGNTTNTGALVRAQYADHLNFDRVWFNTNTGSAFVGIELWDTYFESCEFENMRGSDGLNPAVLLQSTATNSTNQIYFSHCRWESFRDSALVIATGGLSSAWVAAAGANPVYGVYLTDCKMESAFLNGNVMNFSSDVFDIHVDGLYLAADALDSGAAGPVDLINFKALAHVTFSQVHVYAAGSSVARVFRMFPGPVGHAIRDIYVEAVTALTVGIIDFVGGNPAMRITNVRYRTGSGTIYNGTVPAAVILDDVPTVKSSTQTAGYTLTLTDADAVVEMNSATGVAVTVPPNSSVAFPIGTLIEVHQYGAGQVTVTPGAGVTVRTSSSLTSRAQYSTLSLRKRGTNEWVLAGDLT